MKKMLAMLMLLHGSFAFAFEYSSDHDDRRKYEREREEWLESDSRHNERQERYPQNDRQVPIQIYVTPNTDSYSRSRIHRDSTRDRNFQEERYWRERREELENQPQRPYRDNSFYRDENHW